MRPKKHPCILNAVTVLYNAFWFLGRLRTFLLRHGYALRIVGLVIVTAPLGVSSRPLSVGDETREAAIAKEMAASGAFLETKIAGQTLFEKPPFFYAAVAFSIELADGVTPFSARLPSILFSALTLLAAGAAASLLFSPRAGLFTAVVLSTTYLFVVNAHDCVVDVSLTAFVSLGFLAFVAASRRVGFPRWDLAFGLAAAGALLSKGLIGLALLLLLTAPFWFLSPQRRRLQESVSIGTLAPPVGALLLWGGALYASGGLPALTESLWNQQVGRFLGFRAREYSHHRSPVYFYLLSLPGMLFPWVISLPAALWQGFRERRERSASRSRLALGTALLLVLLFLSSAVTKRTIYFLPVVPIAAILIGSFLDAKLSQGTSRIGRALWAQFGLVALVAITVPLLPAIANRRVTLEGGGLVAAVALACVGAAWLARGSAQRLVTVSLLAASFSLVLLDRYCLALLDSDRPTRDFFASVGRRLSARDQVYSYNLNENVLGRACLDLPQYPIVENNVERLGKAMSQPRAFLLAETATLGGHASGWALNLESVEEGKAGNRSVALYRFRSGGPDGARRRSAVRADEAPPARAFSRAPWPYFTRSSAGLSARESESPTHAVRKEESTNQNRQKDRGNHGGNLCSGCLTNPERLARDELAPDQETFDDEIEYEGEGEAQEDPFPLARKADRVFDSSPEDESQGRPQEAIPERGGQVAKEESPERHPRASCGEEDDRAQAIQVSGQKDDAVAVAIEGCLDFLNLLWRENLLQEPVAIQAPAKKRAKPVENRVGNHNAQERGSDHEREARHTFEHQEPGD